MNTHAHTPSPHPTHAHPIHLPHTCKTVSVYSVSILVFPLFFVQSVVEENSKLKSEVKRLKEDNKDLVQKTKSAIKDVDQVQVSLFNCRFGFGLRVLFMSVQVISIIKVTHLH